MHSSSFDHSVWTPGLEAKIKALRTNSGEPPELTHDASSTDGEQDQKEDVKSSRGSLSRRKSITGEVFDNLSAAKKSVSSLLHLKGDLSSSASPHHRKSAQQMLYRIFHMNEANSQQTPGTTAEAVVVKSHKFSNDSDIDFSEDDSASSSHSDIECQTPLSLSAGMQASPGSLPRLNTGGLFHARSRRSPGADSDSESDFDAPPNTRSSLRRQSSSSLLNLKNLLSNNKDASPSNTLKRGTASKSMRSSTGGGDAFNREGAFALPQHAQLSSDNECAGPPAAGSKGNIFKGIMYGKRRTASMSSENLKQMVPPPRSNSRSPALDAVASEVGGAARRKPPLPRSDSESSLSEKYGPSAKKELGRGVSAVVRLCSPVNSDKKYAVKEFLPKRKGETQKEYVKKLMNEFCISSSLDHENIVKTVDLIQDEKKKWCVVMDYAEGGSLFPKIVNGSLSDPVVINCFFKQLLRGVAYLHSQGVAHRDLKPENLLLDASNRILKITDFGVSDVFRGPWQTQSRKACGECGSGPYIAPEIFVDKEYDAEQVDVWSMGVIYYAMIYRSTPWNSAKNSDARYRVFAENREDYWTTFRMVPPASEVREVLYRILEPNPTKRAHVHEILEDPFIQGIECCESGIPTHMVAHSHHGLI